MRMGASLTAENSLSKLRELSRANELPRCRISCWVLAKNGWCLTTSRRTVIATARWVLPVQVRPYKSSQPSGSEANVSAACTAAARDARSSLTAPFLYTLKLSKVIHASIGEFSIWPYDKESATAFFGLLSARYECGSIILTSNKGFADWEKLLGDTLIATAIRDRLTHHVHIIEMNGDSYRLRQSSRATATSS